MIRVRVVLACVAALLVTACGGGAAPGGAAPADPGAGRKPASGAWLEFSVGEWKAQDHGTPTERRFAKGTAYGTEEMLKQPVIITNIAKGNNTDVRQMAGMFNDDFKDATEDDHHGEAWCARKSSVCFVQLNGGHIKLNGSNVTHAEIGAFATELYATLSDDANQPEPTGSPTPDNPGAGRKPVPAALPDRAGEFAAQGPLISPTMRMYARNKITNTSEAVTVTIYSGDLNAEQRAKLGSSRAEKIAEAWCTPTVGQSARYGCWVQVDGGILEFIGARNVPDEDVSALAEALYNAL